MATTGRRRKNDPSTTAALVAMTENGLTRKDAGRILGLSKEAVDKALDTARLEIAARASEYADLHLQASRAAAEKGRAEPMQWALERIGVVKPEPVAPSGGGPSGPVIKIGIMLPGLAPEPVITVTPDDPQARHRSEG